MTNAGPAIVAIQSNRIAGGTGRDIDTQTSGHRCHGVSGGESTTGTPGADTRVWPDCA